MNEAASTVAINVDGRELTAERGQSILDVARKNNIYIPTLCAHKDLTPFGGCRVCIVEVDGMRGFPTACTTPVENGMTIRTDSPGIQEQRREILRLVLSEHPSSCLICDEKDECRQYMGTIRKVGLTTGCRYCPSDGHCELQHVVEKSGLKSIDYPIRYRDFEVEKIDPFYDRDYNLCILCGRCVRICKEVRGADILAFKDRGPAMIIGPAYHRTHLEAGCEFCGDCVVACPTGALAEKANKWKGKPDRYTTTTCPFCGVGCRMHLQVKEGEIIGSLPAGDPIVNEGQLCVKGRFCVTELVNNHRRLKSPYQVKDGHRLDIGWKEAVNLAAEKLSACSPERFAMLVSPNCCNEDLYVAQKFARLVMGSNHIDTTARLFYGPGFNSYLKLMGLSGPLSDVKKASTILCIGLDTRFGRSVVGVQLRNAIKRGAKVISIHPHHHNLEIISDIWIRPLPGMEAGLLRAISNLINKDETTAPEPWSEEDAGCSGQQASDVAKMLRQAYSPVILLGSEFLMYDESSRILENVKELAQSIGAGIVILPVHNNLVGSVLMGTYPEILPGGFSIHNPGRLEELKTKWGFDPASLPALWTGEALWSEPNMEVVYLVGEIPSRSRPPSDFLIFQNIYPPDSSFEADLVLPAAAFSEADGTFINGEGRVQGTRKAVEPPGQAQPDWQILCWIAQKMGKSGFEFSNAREIHGEIAGLVEGFGDFENPERKAGPISVEGNFRTRAWESRELKERRRDFPLMLTASMIEHSYRGFALSAWVEGARKLFADGVVEVNPEDAQGEGISDGDEVVVISDTFEKVWTAKIVKSQRRGILRVTVPMDEFPRPNPCQVRIRKKDV